MSENATRWGVLLLAHGAPDKLEDIPDFLLNVRNGRPLPPPVVEEIKHRYALIGGGSPLLCHTLEQARLLEARLGHPVYVGMRNWKPYVREAIEQVASDGIEHLVVICLAPQNSRTSVGLYRTKLDEAVETVGARCSIDFVESWHDNAFLVRAFAEKLRTALQNARDAAGGDVPVILTAHSVPERTIAAGDPYHEQVQATIAGVVRQAGCALWRSAYQSQGMTSEPWLGPKVESIIDELAAAGLKHVLVAPVGFVCDHVEILYDIDILFRKHAEKKGLILWRTESLNESPSLIEALAAVVEERLAAGRVRSQ